MDLEIKEVILVGLFAALTAVGAFIRIPIPYVPFTLQILFVLFAGSLLGSRLGLLSQVVYILTGLVGVPIFVHGGGPSYVFQPTFGYLVGFALGAYVIGKIIDNIQEKKFIHFLIANLAGLTVVYILGVSYLYFNFNFIIGKSFSLMKAVQIGFLVPVPGDLFLAIVAALISKKVLAQVRNILLIENKN
ncbi:biotin transporter BioY [Sporohalobacter salinus]|uniref:biotin transporter BioY n=1 Tax=Sporohalobacter salinus TaxID=1494606 RepID=UPI00196039A2|nr:biotin transporter BioY [Sporohalobacter salinus]MBM7625082.1 biotin transport system substrate-specific component [Sporohalobacter salinus]